MAPSVDWSDRLLGKPTPPPGWARPAMAVVGAAAVVLIFIALAVAIIVGAFSHHGTATTAVRRPPSVHYQTKPIIGAKSPAASSTTPTTAAQATVSVTDASSGGAIKIPQSADQLIQQAAIAVETGQWAGIPLAQGAAPTSISPSVSSATVDNVQVLSAQLNGSVYTSILTSVLLSTPSGPAVQNVQVQLQGSQWVVGAATA